MYTAPINPVVSDVTRDELQRVVDLLQRVINGEDQRRYCLTWAQRHMIIATEAIARDSTREPIDMSIGAFIEVGGIHDRPEQHP